VNNLDRKKRYSGQEISMHPKASHGTLRRRAEYICAVLPALLILTFGILDHGAPAVFASDAQSGKPTATISSVRIQGTVVRNTRQPHSTVIVPDAVVTLCQKPSGASAIDPSCDSLATTVSDVNGDFDLSLDISSLPATSFVLEAQGPAGQLAVLTLGKDPAQWPSSVRLEFENSETRSERLEEAASQLRRQVEVLTNQTADSESRAVKLRLQLADQIRQQSALQAKLALGATDRSRLNSQIDDLRKGQLDTKNQIALLNRKKLEFRGQQEKINIDLGKIFEQQERERHENGVDTHHVFFATDRAVSKPGEPIKLLNLPSSDGVITLGACDSSVDLLPGATEPNRHLGRTSDADRYYAVQSIKTLSANKFWTEVDSALGVVSSHDALLYVHGYRSSFNDACRRAAQIAADLKFSGPVFLWSWPSRDELSGYFSDEKMAVWSSEHFTTFLKQILSQRGLHHLHIVAHSMGNRVLEQALISPRLTPAEQAHLGQIVFAAPDLSRSAFDSQCTPSNIAALRITLYASKHDQALRAAKVAHPFSRLGDANPDIDIRSGMDSIDASAVDTSLVGHSYIGNSRSVLADVAALISSNATPDKRGLVKMGQSPRQWWLLNP
jgi:esterase/lipase superfamily enzyme